MTQLITIHPMNPQPRLIKQVVELLQAGGVIAYPTDSGYALGCGLDNKAGVALIRQIRGLDEKHLFTLICQDLSELGSYAIVNNPAFRLLKAHTPGPYTFILQATSLVPKRLQHSKRKTIGLRIPNNPIALALLAAMGEPFVSVSLSLANNGLSEQPDCIYDHLRGKIDAVVDGGFLPIVPTTVIDLRGENPEMIRIGSGDPMDF